MDRIIYSADTIIFSSLPHPPPPSLKSGQIEFMIPEDMQCSEKYAKTILTKCLFQVFFYPYYFKDMLKLHVLKNVLYHNISLSLIYPGLYQVWSLFF